MIAAAMTVAVERAPVAASDEVVLRPATVADALQLHRWNFAHDVRAQAIDARPVSFAAHQRWLARRLECTALPFWIITQDDLDLGTIRIEAGDANIATVAIALDPRARGRGVGRQAIAAAVRAWGLPLRAEILASNLASLRAFAAAGFRADGSRPLADGRLLIITRWRPIDAAS